MNTRITSRINSIARKSRVDDHPHNREPFAMDTINTLQEFMLHTKNIIYIIVVMVLLAMPAFWKFLTGGDDE